MPAKGSRFLYNDRDYIFNMKFYKELLVKKSKVTLSFEECKNLIEQTNLNVAEMIKDEDDGFKLPFGLGYLCISRFVPKKEAIDWKKSKEVGKRVIYLNLHTFGFSCRLNWFRVGRISHTHFHESYRFKPYRTFSQKISKSFGSGKPYSDWTISDFIEKSRLENLYSKKYRKEQKL